MNRRLERLTEDQRAAQERYLQEMREGFGRVVAGDAEFCREVREGFDRVVALLQQGGAAGVAESLTCANEMKALKYIK